MSGFLQSRNVRFPISTSHGLVSAEQAVAARRGVPERALQRFRGHASVLSTRRYARLADHALIEVLRPAKAGWRQREQRRGYLDAISVAIAPAILGVA